MRNSVNEEIEPFSRRSGLIKSVNLLLSHEAFSG